MTTAREMVDSLTGFEEDAIFQVTGFTLDSLAEGIHRPDGSVVSFDIKLTRVLAAVKLHRENEKPYVDAWREVQGMKQADLGAVFEDEPDDFIPTEPDSEAGKDDSRPQDEPTSSPPSASQPA